MFKLSFCLLALLDICQCSLKLQPDLLKDCLFGSETFWRIYERHFEITHTITVRILDSNVGRYITNRYVDLALEEFYKNNKLSSSVIIKRRYMKFSQKKPSPMLSFQTASDTELSKHRLIDNEALLNIKRSTSDIQNGNVIIVWNEDILLNYLERHRDLVLGHPRSLYLFIFISPTSHHILSWTRRIGIILELLWKEYKILNALGQSVCSENDDVHIFKPFHRNIDDSWGAVARVSMDNLRENLYLIYNDLNDLRGYRVKTAIFSRLPTVLAVLPKEMRRNPLYKNLSRSGGFGGPDAMIIGELAQKMNFTVQVINSTETGVFGSILENGTVTGALGDVAYKRADIAGNARFVFRPNKSMFEYTYGFSNDIICVVVPKADKVPQWLLMFNAFSLVSWIAIVASLLIFLVVTYLDLSFQRVFMGRTVYLQNLLAVYAILLSTSAKIPHHGEQRLLLAGWIASCLVIVGIFEGTLYKSFSTISYYKDIDTFEELDRSGYPIVTSLDVFINDTVEVINRLHKKQIDINGNSLRTAALYRNICAVERKDDARLFLSTVYVNEDGSPRLHQMKECPVSYYLAQIVPYGSPFLLKFNVFLQRFVESGFVQKWYNDIVNGIITEKQSHFHGEDKIQVPVNLATLSFAFFSLIVGLTISFGVFCLEWSYYVCKKDQIIFLN